MSRCRRCRKETSAITCSMFNDDMICMDCDDAEMAHPQYAEAKEAEAAAVRGGDYNFSGIGRPADL